MKLYTVLIISLLVAHQPDSNVMLWGPYFAAANVPTQKFILPKPTLNSLLSHSIFTGILLFLQDFNWQNIYVYTY